jgi:hypothetical protein
LFRELQARFIEDPAMAFALAGAVLLLGGFGLPPVFAHVIVIE